MKVRVVIVSPLLLLLLVCPNQASAATATKEKQQQEPTTNRPWLVNDYPHPDKEEETDTHQHQQQPSCRSRGQSKRFCDPDGILQATPADLERLDETLRFFYRSRHVCPDDAAAEDEHEKEHGVEIQFAVALVDKMDLTPFQEKYTYGSHHPDIESLAAETFGRSIHDNWGVGLDRPQCGGGTGVLIFISRQDHAVYISRGGALDKILTNNRLQNIIIEQTMKPLLRQGQFAQACIQAINKMIYYLESGPPSFWEKHAESIMVFSFLSVFVSMIFSMIYWAEYKDHQDRMRYSQVTRHLNEIDQARAEALQGQFRCRSCPICLEPFQAPPSSSRLVAPPKPAVTGRDSSEANAMNQTRNACSMDISNSNGSNTEQPKHGSDGLPLTLLRCGHVFDQTCWLEWVKSGRGQIDKCPICKQHIDGVNGGSVQDDQQSQSLERNTNGERLLRRRNDASTHRQTERNINDSTNTFQSTTNNNRDNHGSFPRQNSQSRQQRQLLHDRILSMYMLDRNFRLARLGYYYPQIVGPEQIQNWTRNNYNGPLVRDPAFVRVDPQVRTAVEAAERAQNQNNNSRGGGGHHSSGFGGGRSGGGAGGRW